MCTGFTGPLDALHGDAFNQKVRSSASVSLCNFFLILQSKPIWSLCLGILWYRPVQLITDQWVCMDWHSWVTVASTSILHSIKEEVGREGGFNPLPFHIPFFSQNRSPAINIPNVYDTCRKIPLSYTGVLAVTIIIAVLSVIFCDPFIY